MIEPFHHVILRMRDLIIPDLHHLSGCIMIEPFHHVILCIRDPIIPDLHPLSGCIIVVFFLSF
jgi:hypothetical protein